MFDSVNKEVIDKLVTEVKGSPIGVTDLKVKFPGYVVFV